MDPTTSIVSSLIMMGIAFLFVAVVFLLIRAIVLWYWRVTEIVRLLEEQLVMLKRVAEALAPRQGPHA